MIREAGLDAGPAETLAVLSAVNQLIRSKIRSISAFVQ